MLDMAAKFEAHRRQEPVAEIMVLPGTKALEKRSCENIGGHRLLNRRIDGPTAFARILDVTRKVCKRGVFGKRHGGRSSSQDEMTLPRRHTSAISARSKVNRSLSGRRASALPRKMPKPSA
jgi:hypothetical protein